MAEFNVVNRGHRYVIVDDVLSPEALGAWRNAEHAAQYRPSFSTVTPEFDGISFYSDASLSRVGLKEAYIDEVRHALLVALGNLSLDPEGGSLDAFRFWRYGRGSGLDWHDDGKQRAAAFIVYMSARWQANWGGELELFDCSVHDVPCVHHDVPQDLMNAPVLATSILPKPNRLVVMVGETFHRVRAVEANAGDNLRCSISGFVIKKN